MLLIFVKIQSRKGATKVSLSFVVRLIVDSTALNWTELRSKKSHKDTNTVGEKTPSNWPDTIESRKRAPLRANLITLAEL